MKSEVAEVDDTYKYRRLLAMCAAGANT